MRVRLRDEFIEPENLFGPLQFSSDSFEKFFVTKSIDLMLKETRNKSKQDFKYISVFENDISWMYDIELSESLQDQNMEIIFNDSRVYFKVIKRINKNDFLNAFPSKDLEISLGLQYIPFNSNKEYKCKKCLKSFQYQYNLMLHYRYFCSFNINNLLKDSNSKRIEHLSQFENLKRKQNDLISVDIPFKKKISSIQDFSVNHSLKDYFLSQLNFFVANQNKQSNSLQKSSVMLSPSLSPYQSRSETSAYDLKSNSTINPSLIRNPNLSLTISAQGSSISQSPLGTPDLQNWCVKCNTHFRLTSDLVYHMRTFHRKDETRPNFSLNNFRVNSKCMDNIVRLNREIKFLRCEICNETFKEKHHLTRHLTSHR